MPFGVCLQGARDVAPVCVPLIITAWVSHWESYPNKLDKISLHSKHTKCRGGGGGGGGYIDEQRESS